MGRAPCCDKENVKKGPWSPEEDEKLKEYIEKHGTGGNWIALPHKAGLRRCGKSCRLRWLNYLRPNIKHGEFSDEEDRIIYTLFASIGSRWSIIAAQLPGRTDNDIKNYWNTKLKKKLIMGLIPSSHHNQKTPHQSTTYPSTSSLIQNSSPPLIYSSAAPSPTLVRPQENYLNVGPIQYHYQVKDHSSVLLMFGGHDQASCSSSDGSTCNNNQISHGREMEHINYGVPNGQAMALESYLHSGFDENHKFMISGAEKPIDGLCDETSVVDYSSLEEIKQLISTNNGCNNSMFFVDECRTDEKAMYY